jgi:hypothetical protein
VVRAPGPTSGGVAVNGGVPPISVTRFPVFIGIRDAVAAKSPSAKELAAESSQESSYGWFFPEVRAPLAILLQLKKGKTFDYQTIVRRGLEITCKRSLIIFRFESEI